MKRLHKAFLPLFLSLTLVHSQPMNPVKIEPKAMLTFACKSCEATFDSPPIRHEDEPSRAHPFRYFAECPDCNIEVEQAAWQVGIFCANAMATGPKTAEGKARSAANLAGHPTPQEASITRFNALKHGANAKTAILFPARPGNYPNCQTCDIPHDYCRTQPACLKKTELFMKHFIAVESNNPEMLKDIHAANQAGLSALFEDMLITIFSDGTTLRTPAYGVTKDGIEFVEYLDTGTGKMVKVEDVRAHPLLKPLFELLSRNNLSLADLNMTPKVQTDQGIAFGNLDDESQSKEQMRQYQEKNLEALEGMKALIQKSNNRVKQDKILQEFTQEQEE